MSNARLTVTSYVVLGMIALRGPSTSYDLKRAVGHSVGYFWPFPHAQLYSEPKKLVDLGLLHVSAEDEGRRRLTYSITDEGMAALKAWMAEPSDDPMQVRDVGQLKLFFGEVAEPKDLVALAEQQIELHRDRIAVYEQMQARFGGLDEVAPRMVPLQLGLELERAALAFWERLHAERA
jgi:DNA-binding PadR family transcriptional regulator